MAGSWTQIDPRLRGDDDENDDQMDYEEDGLPHDEERSLGYNPQINASNYDPQLDHDRRAKKQKLQQRFEHIFEKYGRDFEGIGDEIELETGLIVVDNGHLKNMEHEGDPGYEEAAEFADPTADDVDPALEGDVDQNNTAESGSDGESEDALEDEEDRESVSGDAGNEVFSVDGEAAESATTPFETEDSAGENAPKTGTTHGRATGSAQSRGRKRQFEEVESESEEEEEVYREPTDIFEQLPYLKASMLDLQSKQKLGQSIDPNELETLGMSIARQLADFVNGDKRSPSKPKWNNSKDPVWSYPELPQRMNTQPPQHRNRSPTPLPIFTGPSPGQKSLWAPIQHPKPRKKYKRRKRKGDDEDAEQVDEPTTNHEDEDVAEPAPGQIIDGGARTCTNCECTNSLIWRRGPEGELCNACGMYYYRYGLLRPLGPPSDTEESEIGDYSSDIELTGEGAVDPRLLANDDGDDASNRGGKGLPKGERFKIEDDSMIIKLKEIDRLSWEKIAKHFPGRTAYGVQCRYSKKLHNRPVEARAYLVNQGYESRHDENGVIIFAPAPAQPKGWTEEQDDLLLKLREDDELDWDKIADSFPGRTARAMERRFNHLARKLTKRRSNRPKNKPKKRKDPSARMFMLYSAKEDEQIVKLREVDKLSWAEIAARLPGRNPMALQKRYVRELAYRNQELGEDPLVEVEPGDIRVTRSKHTRFTREEDTHLMHLRDDLGLGWREIETKMPGRKWQSIENRYAYLAEGYSRNPKKKAASAETPDNDDQPEHSDHENEAASEDELVQDSEDITTVEPCPDPAIRSTDQNEKDVVHSKDQEQEQSPNGHGFFSEGNEPFTADEDTRIRKMREIQKLSWEAIAAELPGRSCSAISARYYHSLLPRAESVNPWSKEASLAAFTRAKPLEIASRVNLATSQIASKRTLRWTKEESEMVDGYFDQGLSWEEIGERMPWRSWKAIKHFHNVNFPGKRSKGKLVAPKVKNQLLRRAIGNTARYSMPTQNTCSPLIDLTGDDSGDESPSKQARLEEQSRESRPHLKRLLPRPMPSEEKSRLRDKYAPGMSAPPPRTAPVRNPLPHGHPPQSETASVNAYASVLSSYLASRESPSKGANTAALANPITPSRPQQHAHPISAPSVPKSSKTINYFTPVSHDPHPYPYYIPPPVNKDGPMFSKPTSTVQASDVDPRLLEGGSSAPNIPRIVPRAVFEPAVSSLREPAVISPEAIDKDVSRKPSNESEMNPVFDQSELDQQLMMDDDDAFQYDDYVSAGEAYVEGDNIQDPAAEGQSTADAQITHELEETLDTQQDAEHVEINAEPDTDDEFEGQDPPSVDIAPVDFDNAAGEEVSLEQEDSFESLPSEHADMGSTADEAEPELAHESPPSSLPPIDTSTHENEAEKEVADSTEESIIFDDQSESEAESPEPDHGTPPPHSWEKMLIMAFKANGTRSLNVKDIYKFIEGKFPYYRKNSSAWKEGIQTCLEEKPEFVQMSRSRPLWVFKSSLQQERPESREEVVLESDLKICSERSITAKSLRERKPKVQEAESAKRGPGRPRKTQKAGHKPQDEEGSEQNSEPKTRESDDEDELAPSPEKKAALALRSSKIQSSPSLPSSGRRFDKTQNLSSDINRDPDSSPYPGPSAVKDRLLNQHNSAILSSSSPLVSMKTPGTVYSKADTPGTGVSTLFGNGRPQHRGVAALRSSFGGASVRSRSSSVALPGSRKRVVYTPVRDVGEFEDELA